VSGLVSHVVAVFHAESLAVIALAPKCIALAPKCRPPLSLRAMRHVIAILLQNEAGALTRVTGLISSRGYNIESLSVAPTNDPTVSRVTLVTIGSDPVIAQINAQLQKLVDVVAVEDMTSGDHLARELMLIKLQLASAHIGAVTDLARRVGGRILASNPSSFIVELASTEVEIGEFIANVGAFGEIVEVVRSGVLGISRANPRLHAVK
jgi:acetolactate synthase-1/3 small subunit